MAKLDILSLAYVNNGIISVSINRSHFSSKFGKDNCPYMFRQTCSLKYFLSDKFLFFNNTERDFPAKKNQEIRVLESLQNTVGIT